MAISYNNLQSAINTTTLVGYTPPSLTDSCLVVIVTSEDVGNNDPITNISFGGVNLTEGVIAHSVVGSNAQDVAIFYLVNPLSASGDISVTGSQRQSIIAMTLDGVDQSSPIDTTGVAEVASTTDLSVSATTSNSNSFAVSGVVGDNTSNVLTLTTGTKIISLTPSSASSAAAVSTQASAGLFSHDWVSSASVTRGASAVVAFSEVSSGSGIEGDITQTTASFTQSASGAVVSNITGTITQTTQSFTQSALGVITSANFSGSINQITSSFEQSATGVVTSLGIVGSISQELSSFTQSGHGLVISNTSGIIEQTTGSFTQESTCLIITPVEGLINQTVSSFTQSANGQVPASWTDKPAAATNWTDKTKVTTIWS